MCGEGWRFACLDLGEISIHNYVIETGLSCNVISQTLPFLPELVLECLQFGVPFQLEHIGKVIFVL